MSTYKKLNSNHQPKLDPTYEELKKAFYANRKEDTSKAYDFENEENDDVDDDWL